MPTHTKLSLYTGSVKKIALLLSLFCFLCNLQRVYCQKVEGSKVGFLHGVASGDPMADRVIIWSRITPQDEGTIYVKWILAKDKECRIVVKSGQLTTSASKDYTIKVDVEGVAAATTYYYKFIAGNESSPVGRTKTTAASGLSDLNFAVISCSNYAEGYFTALGKIADRQYLDGVIHLGDYIYEGIERAFETRKVDIKAQKESARGKDKDWWLDYYRKRYEISRLDSNLMKAHLTHPFITIWDDHETADNAYKDGAKAHNPAVDGLWEERKKAAKQAYAEWMPIRGDASRIYRSLKFGNLAELILLDTRLEGRDKQIESPSDPDLSKHSRSMLGLQQKSYLLNKLKTSTAKWKVIGNQVIFSDFNVSWAANAGPFSSQVKQLESTLLDYWQGYPAEREQILSHINSNKINNVVILSASMHCALASEVAYTPNLANNKDKNTTYESKSGKGSLAVEFAAPSISSANFDEKIGEYAASSFESITNKMLPPPFNFNPNPHIKFVDLMQHGYFILHLSQERAQADFYFIKDKFKASTSEAYAQGWYSNTNENRLQKALSETNRK